MKIKKKLSNILSGWKNLIIKNEELEPLFLNRMTQGCNNCEYNVFEGILKTCSICGCPLASKTRALDEECPYPKGSKWLPVPRYDEQGAFRLRSELPENLQQYFDNEVIEEEEWKEFVEKHK